MRDVVDTIFNANSNIYKANTSGLAVLAYDEVFILIYQGGGSVITVGGGGLTSL